MIKKLIILVSFVFICACAEPYKIPDKPRGELKPQFSKYDVVIQNALVDGWKDKCNSTNSKIFCDKYDEEHKNLENFYYDLE